MYVLVEDRSLSCEALCLTYHDSSMRESWSMSDASTVSSRNESLMSQLLSSTAWTTSSSHSFVPAMLGIFLHVNTLFSTS